MVRLAITLLGPFQVCLDGQPVTAFASHKVRALLAYLAAEAHRPHPRGVLADLLWPERTDRNALRNLSSALADLRTAIGDRDARTPVLAVDRHALQLCLHAGVTVDALDLAASAYPGHTLAPHDLQSIVALYRGPFLEGFPSTSAPFEEWVLLKRERCSRLVLDALRRLAEHSESRGEWEEAARYARRQLELEPWDEGAHRQLMRALTLGGHRGVALAHYDACRRALADDLGVDPEPETQALYQEILKGALTAPPKIPAPLVQRPAPPPSSPAATGRGAPAFVGREPELHRLHGLLREVLQGRGQVVFVVGEPGSGKTWLLQEFARRAVSENPDLVVAAGRCNAYAGVGDPYLPFIHVLRALTGDLGDQWPQGVLPEEHAERLHGLLPSVAEALAGEGWLLLRRLVSGVALLERLRSDASGERALLGRLEDALARAERVTPLEPAHLFDRCARVLDTLARRVPLLLVLDDLQWADSASLGLLFHLGRSLAGTRLLLLGAYRSGDLAEGRGGERHPLAPLVGELRAQWPDACVDLDASDGRAFVDSLLDARPNRLDARFRDTLLRHTGGQPLFTVELLRGLQERGDLRRDAEGCWVAEEAVGWGRLPARVEALIAERVDALPRGARALLEVASVEGERFTAEVLAAVGGREVSDVLGALSSPPLRDRLVATDGVQSIAEQRLSRYRFRHELVRAYLYNSLDTAQRAYLHEGVGRALEGLHGERAREVAATLAWHYERASLMLRAATHLDRAARRAIHLTAVPEAEALCRRGLALLAREPESAERAAHEVRLLTALAVATTRLKDNVAPEFVQALERAEDLCRRYGIDRELSWVLGIRTTTMTPRQARPLAEEALRLAERTGAPEALAFAHYVLGAVLSACGEFGASWAHFAQALERIRSLPAHGDLVMLPEDLLTRCLAEAAWVQWILGYPDRALAWCERAVARAKAAEWIYTESYVRYYAASILMVRGEWEATRRHLDVLAVGETELNKPADHVVWVQVTRAATVIASGGGGEALLDEALAGLDAYCRYSPARRNALALLTVVARACARGG